LVHTLEGFDRWITGAFFSDRSTVIAREEQATNTKQTPDNLKA
jgi:hypothetical protein